MSKKTIEMHWGEHHRNFVEGLNKQLEKDDILYGYTMDELVKETYNNGNPLPEFNNAAEVLVKLIAWYQLFQLFETLRLLVYLYMTNSSTICAFDFTKERKLLVTYFLLLFYVGVGGWLYPFVQKNSVLKICHFGML